MVTQVHSAEDYAKEVAAAQSSGQLLVVDFTAAYLSQTNQFFNYHDNYNTDANSNNDR